MKMQDLDWKKIPAKYISDKGFASRIHTPKHTHTHTHTESLLYINYTSIKT